MKKISQLKKYVRIVKTIDKELLQLPFDLMLFRIETNKTIAKLTREFEEYKKAIRQLKAINNFLRINI